MIVSETLEELGYQIHEAIDGVAALALLRSGASVDLLLSDVGLPGGMDGWHLAEQATTINGSLKTLLIIGYLQNDDLKLGKHVLTKPFTLKELGVRVGELLAG